MKMESLYLAINKHVKLDALSKDLLADFFVFREVPKRYKLVDYGEKSDELYYLNKGCLRLYYIKDNGDEVTGYFFTEGMFCSSFESFLTGKPSIQIIESLEDSELWVLKRKGLDQLYNLLPSFNVFVRKILEERFISAQQVVASYILHSPEERYIKMLESNPQILNRVPQHTLATFLGMTPVSLSRIRKRILG